MGTRAIKFTYDKPCGTNNQSASHDQIQKTDNYARKF